MLAILEDEIQLLPAAYRLAVALCCVQGLSREEAARRLNTTPGSIRGLVERGRARLHARLAARGLAPACVLALAGFAQGAVPSTAYTAASRVLAEGVLRAMFLTKMKVLAAVLLLAACVMGATTVQPGHAGEQPKKPAPVTPPDAAKPDPPDWGEPDGGVQIRIRPLKTVWAAGETPTFEIDLRAAPESREVGVANYHHVDRVDIDGEEYELNPFTWKPVRGGWRVGNMLEPGQELAKAGAASLGEYRPVKGEDRPLKPGKHVIRMTALVAVDRNYARPRSRPVVIEVKEDAGAKKPEPPEWGEPVEGMQCRLQADRLVWAAGEWPSFTAGVRYTSDRPPGQERSVWVGDTQEYFSIEIDGRWFHRKATSVAVPAAPFPSGGEKAGIAIGTKGGWQDATGKAPEALTVGKHTVRVALVPIHRDSGEPMRAVSAPVQIEVRNAAAEKAGDAALLRGRWKVVKDEYPDAKREKWVETAKKATDTFAFTADKVAWSGEGSYGSYHLILNDDKKTIRMTSEAIHGIADVRAGVYRLDGDKLTICWGEGSKVPADFTPKAPAARLCHLERVLTAADLTGRWQSTGGEERVTLDLRDGAYVMERRALALGSAKLPHVETVSTGTWDFKDDRVGLKEERYVTDGQVAAVREKSEAFTRKGKGLVGDKGTELVRADGAAGLATKLQGEWVGGGACQGDVTFKADGTYSWLHYGPGDATVVGTWSLRWDALPPTLVLTSTASNDKDYIGTTAEVKVLRLDGKTLVYEQNRHKVEFTREAKREPKENRDAKLMSGRWKVAKDEYRVGEKWVEAKVPPDFEFVFTADGATVTREKNSTAFAVTLNPGSREISLARAQGGIDKLERGVYRVGDEWLAVCIVGGHLLPADDASKDATLRLYHLKRVIEPKK